jgi:serine/threonine-protein kinase
MAASPSLTSDEQFAIGSVLDGRYRIDAVLGTGGMGRVYRAEHTKIGKSVAIKVLHADLHRNREASQRFQREAIASGRLDHPNIVGVRDFGVLDDGACYLVMEVLEGESLGDRLARDHRIHWLEAIDILRGVLSGLRHAHERGVVHRDIKPDNIFLAHKDGDAVIKILDFGIAKLYAGTADDPASTRAGLTVGTPAYLSPEQAVGGEITPASDLYSASILLYEMLAGRAPFEDKDPLAMLGAHVSRRPPAFADIVPGVEIPAPLEDIIQCGLRKPAAERIGTAGDYLAMLDAFSPPLQPMPRVGTGPVLDGSARPSASMSAVRRRTPVPGMPETPAPVPATTGSLSAAAAAPASAERAPRSRASHTTSIADVSEPIPLTWIVRSGVVIGLVIVGAIVLTIATHCGGSQPTPSMKSPAPPPTAPVLSTKSSPRPPPAEAPNTKRLTAPLPSPSPSTPPPPALSPAAARAAKPAAATVTPAAATAKPAVGTAKPAVGAAKPAVGAAKPAVGAAKPAVATAKPAVGAAKPAVGAAKPAVGAAKPAAGAAKPAAGAAKPLDHAAQLKALLHDLELGKTCAERKASIAKLVGLHDAHAVPALKRARARVGGRAGNDNACLKVEAAHAIKELGGTLK